VSPHIVGSILIGADDLVAELVASRIPHMAGASWGPCVALGVVRNGVLLGGFVYNNYRGHDVQLNAAFDRPGWALPQTLRALFNYPFNQMGVARVTAVTGKSNHKARKGLLDLGFSQEGAHRRGLDGIETAISYGMLREQCRWIKPHETRINAAAAA